MLQKIYFDMFDDRQQEIVDVHIKIGVNVRKIRKDRGVTQLDLALALGFKTASSFAKLESCIENKHFNIEHLYKISKVLEVSILDIFHGVDTIQPDVISLD